jgi:hypothetical protein
MWATGRSSLVGLYSTLTRTRDTEFKYVRDCWRVAVLGCLQHCVEGPDPSAMSALTRFDRSPARRRIGLSHIGPVVCRINYQNTQWLLLSGVW